MLSASYFDQESNYVGPDYGVKRYNLRSNLTTEFGRLKLGANVGFTRSEINSPSDANEGFLFADLIRFPNYYFNRHEAVSYTHLNNKFKTATKTCIPPFWLPASLPWPPSESTRSSRTS